MIRRIFAGWFAALAIGVCVTYAFAEPVLPGGDTPVMESPSWTGAPAIPGPGKTSVRVVSSLLVVLALVCLAVPILKKSLAAGGWGPLSGPARLRGRLCLAPKTYLCLVQVSGKVLVLGVGDGRVSLLSEMPSSDLPAASPDGTGAAVDISRRFANILRKVITRHET